MKKTLFLIVLIMLFSAVSCGPVTTQANGNDGDVFSSESSFVSVWKTEGESESITLPLVENGIYDFVVNWGDGSQDTITKWDDEKRTHQYDEEKIYTVTISGTIVGWSFGEDNPSSARIVEISQWGSLGFGETSLQFNNCPYLTITAIDTPSLEGTESLEYAFAGCHYLTQIPSTIAWNTESVTTMKSMFSDCNYLTEVLHINEWNLSNVTTTDEMFQGATRFNQNIASWNLSNVLDMSEMFSNATAFNQNIASWNTSRVTDFSKMFNSASSFNQNLSSLDTSAATDMSFMFTMATQFDGDVSQWDVSKVKTMEGMFANAKMFDKDVSEWDVSAVENMMSMFAGANLFNQDIGQWEVGNVTNMATMFANTGAFNQDISQWNVTKVTDMNYMFASVVEVDLDVGPMDGLNVVFDQDLSEWNLSHSPNMSDMFTATTLSTEHYDNMLKIWEAKEYKNIYFSAGYSKYSAGEATDARQKLIDDYGWFITDGGVAE